MKTLNGHTENWFFLSQFPIFENEWYIICNQVKSFRSKLNYKKLRMDRRRHGFVPDSKDLRIDID